MLIGSILAFLFECAPPTSGLAFGTRFFMYPPRSIKRAQTMPQILRIRCHLLKYNKKITAISHAGLIITFEV